MKIQGSFSLFAPRLKVHQNVPQDPRGKTTGVHDLDRLKNRAHLQVGVLARTPMEFLCARGETRKLIYRIHQRRAQIFLAQIRHYLNPGDRVLDLGAGSCSICELLSESRMRVTPLDVKNLSFVDSMKPLLYDGVRIPFDSNQFDVTLILTVLHHTPNPEKIIREALRVSQRIIIIEDIYAGRIHKWLTLLEDSLGNLEFRGHPHTNKKDSEWRSLFTELGLKLKEVGYFSDVPIFQHVVYYLEK